MGGGDDLFPNILTSPAFFSQAGKAVTTHIFSLCFGPAPHTAYPTRLFVYRAIMSLVTKVPVLPGPRTMKEGELGELGGHGRRAPGLPCASGDTA